MPATKRKTGTAAGKKKAATKKAAPAKAKGTKARAKTAATKKTATKKAPATRKGAGAKKTGTRSARKTATERKAASRPRGKDMAAPSAGRGLDVGPIRGFRPYEPRKGEEYMSERQLEHFRQILLAWKRELMEEVDRTVHHMQDEAGNFPDPNDRATQEEEFSLELRTRDRERKLIRKIDEALKRIEDGEYGYCESCGVEIGIRRLEARPTATLCIDCKTLDEVRERQMGL